MKPASVTSPFSSIDTGDEWVHWQKEQPLLCLQEGIETERRSLINDKIEDDPGDEWQKPIIPYIMPIQRPQYNAVLEHFTRASKRTTAFSTWPQ